MAVLGSCDANVNLVQDVLETSMHYQGCNVLSSVHRKGTGSFCGFFDLKVCPAAFTSKHCNPPGFIL